MAISITSVCNRGLQHLGAARILDINEDTRNGRACKAAYDGVRRSELRKHTWRFAIKRVNLASMVAVPVGDDYGYQYQLPADCVRILKPRDTYLDWQVEGGRILTNDAGPLFLRYVADIEDVTLWDTLYAESISLKMGEAMCEQITQSNTKKATIKDDYKELIKEARKANAFETIPAEPEDDGWVLARL